MLSKVARSVTNYDFCARTVRLKLKARGALSSARAITGVGVLNERALALFGSAFALADLLVVEMLVAALMVWALVLVVVKLGALTVRPVRGSV